MIPREILKKIRQIELRTNRLVTEFATGARASARFTARTPATSKTNLALNSIRTLKRRERRAPAAPERENQLVFLPALTCVLSARRGFQPGTFSVYPAGNSTNPAAGCSKDAGSVSPSPWGEGRDEGGRESNFPLAGFSFQPLARWPRCRQAFPRLKSNGGSLNGFMAGLRPFEIQNHELRSRSRGKDPRIGHPENL